MVKFNQPILSELLRFLVDTDNEYENSRWCVIRN